MEENGDWTPMIRDDDNKAVLAPQKRRDGGPPGTSKALLTPKEEIGETKGFHLSHIDKVLPS